jgi:hypothetical protein
MVSEAVDDSRSGCFGVLEYIEVKREFPTCIEFLQEVGHCLDVIHASVERPYRWPILVNAHEKGIQRLGHGFSSLDHRLPVT